MSKKSSLKSLKKKLWDLVSRLVRLINADDKGYVKCVTCGAVKPWKELQAGHFIDGKMNSILYDLRGIHPQCYSCNMYKAGNKVEYFRFMQQNQGDWVIDDLRRLSKIARKFTINELELEIEDYKESLKSLEVKKP